MSARTKKPKGYVAKVTTYLYIESDYADGIGEAQREVSSIIESLTTSDPTVKVACVVYEDPMKEFLPGKLVTKPGESHDQVIHVLPDGKEIEIDDGIF